jgi:hypothetical protein
MESWMLGMFPSRNQARKYGMADSRAGNANRERQGLVRSPRSEERGQRGRRGCMGVRVWSCRERVRTVTPVSVCNTRVPEPTSISVQAMSSGAINGLALSLSLWACGRRPSTATWPLVYLANQDSRTLALYSCCSVGIRKVAGGADTTANNTPGSIRRSAFLLLLLLIWTADASYAGVSWGSVYGVVVVNAPSTCLMSDQRRHSLAAFLAHHTD